MLEIQKGIYIYKEKLANPSLNTLLVMHPYFKESEQIQVEQKIPGDSYANARDRIFESWRNKGNVVVFEMSRNYWFNIFMQKVFPKFDEGLYLIPTEVPMPDPARTSWKEVAEFLKSLNKDISFAGGGLNGCLGGAIHHFREIGLEGQIIGEACYH